MTIVFDDKKSDAGQRIHIHPRRGASKLLTYRAWAALTRDFNVSAYSVHASIEKVMQTCVKTSKNRLQIQ
jgi:hypothetical protein